MRLAEYTVRRARLESTAAERPAGTSVHHHPAALVNGSFLPPFVSLFASSSPTPPPPLTPRNVGVTMLARRIRSRFLFLCLSRVSERKDARAYSTHVARREFSPDVTLLRSRVASVSRAFVHARAHACARVHYVFPAYGSPAAHRKTYTKRRSS